MQAITRIASDPRVRAAAFRIGKNLARSAGGAIIRRRRRRIRMGRRVLGGGIRRTIQRAGLGDYLPIQSRTEAAPVASSHVTGALTPEFMSRRIQKKEAVVDIISPAINTTQKKLWPICAQNEVLFPSLATIASQASYYKFLKLDVNYTPNVATTTAGRIAVGVVADWQTADSIQTINELQAHTHILGNVWADKVALPVVSSSMNRNYIAGQGWESKPYAQTDITQPTQVQGYIVCIVDNCTTAGTTLGKIDITYIVNLIKPRNTTENLALVESHNSTTDRRGLGAGQLAQVVADLNGYTTDNPQFSFAVSGGNINLVYEGTAPYLLSTQTYLAGACTWAFTSTDATVTTLYSNSTATFSHESVTVVPNRTRSTVTIAPGTIGNVVRIRVLLTRLQRYAPAELAALAMP